MMYFRKVNQIDICLSLLSSGIYRKVEGDGQKANEALRGLCPSTEATRRRTLRGKVLFSRVKVSNGLHRGEARAKSCPRSWPRHRPRPENRPWTSPTLGRDVLNLASTSLIHSRSTVVQTRPTSPCLERFAHARIAQPHCQYYCCLDEARMR